SGLNIVVKKLDNKRIHIFEDWQSVVSFLGRLSHCNLVKLLGYCWEDDELLLVNEFMPRGSLETHLFELHSVVQPLPWDIRLKILLGAARGLTFLHTLICTEFKASNILLEFKASNILLDGVRTTAGPEAQEAQSGKEISKSTLAQRARREQECLPSGKENSQVEPLRDKNVGVVIHEERNVNIIRIREEDVDIGDEMPVTHFPPVEIEKDDGAAAGGSCHDNKGHATNSCDRLL
ncbi:hypothetical protein C3L33_19166, partial [Rhododendron williamsianum]